MTPPGREHFQTALTVALSRSCNDASGYGRQHMDIGAVVHNYMSMSAATVPVKVECRTIFRYF